MAISEKNNLELPGIPKAVKRGRPTTGNAKTNAERQALFRERKAAELDQRASSYEKWTDEELIEQIARKTKLSKSAFLALGRRNGWIRGDKVEVI